METINQTKKTVEQLDEMAKVFTTFGTPDKIYTNGDEMTAHHEYATAEGKKKYLRRAAALADNLRYGGGGIMGFTISRINGVVKLYFVAV